MPVNLSDQPAAQAPRAPRAALRPPARLPRRGPPLEAARPEPEPDSAHAERLLYFALVGALEAGLVRTAEDGLTVLRQATQPLGPMGICDTRGRPAGAEIRRFGRCSRRR